MKESKPKIAAAVEAKAKKSESKAKLRVVKEKPKKRQAKPKVKKDPNQPKRPPTAFFVFLEEFRQTFKQKHPDVKGVAAEKAPYLAKAAQKKADYDVSMTAYKKKQVDDEADAAEESDKSKSELNEDDDDDEEDSEDED